MSINSDRERRKEMLLELDESDIELQTVVKNLRDIGDLLYGIGNHLQQQRIFLSTETMKPPEFWNLAGEDIPNESFSKINGPDIMATIKRYYELEKQRHRLCQALGKKYVPTKVGSFPH